MPTMHRYTVLVMDEKSAKVAENDNVRAHTYADALRSAAWGGPVAEVLDRAGEPGDSSVQVVIGRHADDAEPVS